MSKKIKGKKVNRWRPDRITERIRKMLERMEARRLKRSR